MKKIILYVIIGASVLFCIYSIYRLLSVYDTYQIGMEQFHDLEQKVIIGNNTGFTYSALSMYKEPIARQAKLLMLKYLIFAVLAITTMSLSIIKLMNMTNESYISENEKRYCEHDVELMKEYYKEREQKIHEFYKKYRFELEHDEDILRESIMERCEELEEEDNFYKYVKNEGDEI